MPARSNQKICTNQRRGQGLACRLGRCFSTGDPHPALPKIKFTLCDVRFFAAAQHDNSFPRNPCEFVVVVFFGMWYTVYTYMYVRFQGNAHGHMQSGRRIWQF